LEGEAAGRERLLLPLIGEPGIGGIGELLAAAVRRVDGVVGLRDQMRYPPGKATAWTGLPPQQPWLSRVAQALALPFR
jgi:hypothetical protein